MTAELDAVTAEAAKHWDALATEEDRRPSWDRQASVAICASRAELYRRTAESLRIEARTGVPVCVCCFKPYGAPGRY